MLELIQILLRLGLHFFQWWMDPGRQKRIAEEKKEEHDEKQRVEFAQALAERDPITVSYHIDQLLREIKANRSAGRQDSAADRS